MTRRKLPIGLQSFRRIREQGCYYVDKTPHIRRLIDAGDYWFLSRPRRFGKSLLLDTLKALFEGKEELFRGLDIHPHWDWSIQHPVVRLSFDGNYSEPGNLHSNVVSQLAMIEEDAGLEPAENCTAPDRLQTLLHRLHRATGQQVVVLVDEYDKPILDVLDNPDLAKANRDWLRGFYGIVKGSADHVRFVFVTGVSTFSKVSLFSGLNNLEDVHPGSPIRHRLRLHRQRPGHGVCTGAGGAEPGADPPLVQRLPLVGAGEGLQPLRRPAAVPEAGVPALVVRDRLAGVPVPAADGEGSQPHGVGETGYRQAAGLQVRRGGHQRGRTPLPRPAI